MSRKKRSAGSVLGRGLGNLLSQDKKISDEKQKQGIQDIAIGKIQADKDNPRKKFDKSAILELATTIKQHGLLQPILVIPKGETYKVVSGERRLRACRSLGLKSIPCIVKQYSTREKLEISLIENIQREQLDPIEEANVYRNLLKEYNLTQEALSSRVGKNRATIANRIRLLQLPIEIQTAIADGRITEGQARPLLSILNKKEKIDVKAILEEIISRGMSAREIEEWVKVSKRRSQPSLNKSEPPKKDPNITSLEEDLRETLNTRVSIRHHSGKQNGKIIIDYFDLDECERIVNFLKK